MNVTNGKTQKNSQMTYISVKDMNTCIQFLKIQKIGPLAFGTRLIQNFCIIESIGIYKYRGSHWLLFEDLNTGEIDLKFVDFRNVKTLELVRYCF